jgi:seryl-tRNA synthetase
MINIDLIRDEPEKVKEGVAAKQYDPKIVDDVAELDKKYRELLVEVEKVRADKNKFAKAAGSESTKARREKNIEEGKKIKKKLQELEPKLSKMETELQEKLGGIPNPPLPEVPVGKDEKENVEVRKWGEPRKFDFEPKDHLELGKELGILDFETGAKVTGSQFYYLYGDGALLELA